MRLWIFFYDAVGKDELQAKKGFSVVSSLYIFFCVVFLFCLLYFPILSFIYFFWFLCLHCVCLCLVLYCVLVLLPMVEMIEFLFF